ncbi:type VI secretion system ImpA family N-terminal domain-containing protein [Pantoea sp. PNT02]|uniref:VasL domain-containing protein n=1 Tax=Pantoea sp. PNT02 TaxID=2769261 RepID=UPI00177C3763|nr:VasL domain-containing protein [Pantoea sp. PNT02]MBD9642657.1 type VI secretion system ImpA family N-terminal domain-containing protein [Pantoea sp. PNT02]
MTSSQPRLVKTGGDPRALAEYAALRQEMQKLTHPARPDVDWPHVSTLCLTLFEKNGVELQSAVWYTLSRANTAGTAGMTEGLAVLVALITRDWPTLWPQPAHSRIELLAGLSRRLQQFLRTQTITEADLTALSQAARLLGEAGDHLQRLELLQLSQIDPLLDRIRSAVGMLEHCEVSKPDALAKLPEVVPIEKPALTLASAEVSGWVYVPSPGAPAPDLRRLRRRAFINGVGATLLSVSLIAAISYLVVQKTEQESPLQQALLASISPLPAPLTSEMMAELQANPAEWLNEAAWLEQTQQQLNRLQNVSPDWNLQLGNALVMQASLVWPDSDAVKTMSARWNKQLNAAAMPADKMQGWQQGMEQLNALSQRLNGLDEKRGKYLTVSELKTAVYNMTQAFNETVPLEEELRVLQQSDDDATQNQLTQAEMHLKQLIASYQTIATSSKEQD